MYTASLEQFAAAARGFAPGSAFGADLLLCKDGALETYYAPFEYVNAEARIVICGITPGAQQAQIALSVAGDALRTGANIPSAQRLAKETASFAGLMRANLIAMLDSIGIAQYLSIPSAESLFSDRRDLVHYTSALRNPVFINGKNYSGSPNILSTSCLRQQVERFLAEEARQLSGALWVPLGPVVTEALQHLMHLGILTESQVLSGMPHPSGANAERISVFLGRKDPELASKKTNSRALLASRATLCTKIERLRNGQ